MNHLNNHTLTKKAQQLRKAMTKEERHLWFDFLKTFPLPVHRQKVLGTYIVDFYIAQAKLVIELDGSQHYEDEHQNADHVRDRYLQSLGLTVLRYSNEDVNRRFFSVCSDILLHAESFLTQNNPDAD